MLRLGFVHNFYHLRTFSRYAPHREINRWNIITRARELGEKNTRRLAGSRSDIRKRKQVAWKFSEAS